MYESSKMSIFGFWCIGILFCVTESYLCVVVVRIPVLTSCKNSKKKLCICRWHYQ